MMILLVKAIVKIPSDWLPGDDGLCRDPDIDGIFVRSGPLFAPSIGIVAIVLYLNSSGTWEFAFLRIKRVQS